MQTDEGLRSSTSQLHGAPAHTARRAQSVVAAALQSWREQQHTCNNSSSNSSSSSSSAGGSSAAVKALALGVAKYIMYYPAAGAAVRKHCVWHRVPLSEFVHPAGRHCRPA
eukprot:18733-Heterococcus_DN1.PRE.2